MDPDESGFRSRSHEVAALRRVPHYCGPMIAADTDRITAALPAGYRARPFADSEPRFASSNNAYGHASPRSPLVPPFSRPVGQPPPLAWQIMTPCAGSALIETSGIERFGEAWRTFTEREGGAIRVMLHPSPERPETLQYGNEAR